MGSKIFIPFGEERFIQTAIIGEFIKCIDSHTRREYFISYEEWFRLKEVKKGENYFPYGDGFIRYSVDAYLEELALLMPKRMAKFSKKIFAIPNFKK